MLDHLSWNNQPKINFSPTDDWPKVLKKEWSSISTFDELKGVHYDNKKNDDSLKNIEEKLIEECWAKEMKRCKKNTFDNKYFSTFVSFSTKKDDSQYFKPNYLLYLTLLRRNVLLNALKDLYWVFFRFIFRTNFPSLKFVWLDKSKMIFNLT